MKKVHLSRLKLSRIGLATAAMCMANQKMSADDSMSKAHRALPIPYAWNLDSLADDGDYTAGAYRLTISSFTVVPSVGPITNVGPSPTSAYWTGSQSSSWATIDPTTSATNFATAADGATNTFALPDSNTNVTFTATTATNLNSTLDQAFTINSLAFSGTGTSNTAGSTIAAGTGGTASTLTINAANLNGNATGNGITVAAGSGLNTISANVILGGAQTWTVNNSAANPLTLSGSVTGSSNALTTAGVGTVLFTGAGSSIGAFTDQSNVVIDTGGSLTATGTNQVGLNGVSGVLTVRGSGAFTSAGAFNLAVDNGSASGTLNLSGTGSFTNTTGGVNLGLYYRTGAAIVNQSGSSTFNAGSNGVILAGAGVTAYNLSGGTYSAGPMLLGQYNTSTGVFNQSGGTATTGQLSLGETNTSLGYYNLSGGTLNVNGNLFVGRTGGTTNAPGSSAAGYIFQSGGTFNLGAGVTATVSTNNASVGNLTVTGGAFNLNSDLLEGNGTGTAGVGNINVSGAGALNFNSNHALIMGNNSSGGFTTSQNGGTITFFSNAGTTVGGTGAVYLGFNSSQGRNTFNLNGGTLTPSRVTASLGTTGTATFNFNGGTLQAAGASTTFMQGLTSANVYGNGAKIDSNGSNITVAQPLLATTGNGVDTVTLTASGANYVIAPIVTFSAPASGTAATGYAVLDASGQVSSIVITNPGTGYTGAPTVTLSTNYNGGNTYNLGTAPTTATATASANLNNANGGLTKLGTGILTLTGASTYTGATNVTAGVLSLTTGSINGSNSVNVGSTGALTLTNATALSDLGTLSLVSGAALNLNAANGTTETIGSLILNGVTEAPGTYSFTALQGLPGASGITFTSSFGETLTIAAVPEPSTLLAGFLCAAMLGYHFRRRFYVPLSFSRTQPVKE